LLLAHLYVTPATIYILFLSFFSLSRDHRHLHSFPTRRSSDLVVFYPREKRNLSPSPVHGIGSAPDPRWDNVRHNMGYIRGYGARDRKSTRLNSSHVEISYAVFCLKKKTKTSTRRMDRRTDWTG